jgi:hypothetical protein
VTVASAAEGIVAKTDLVEVEGGAVVPVDYKRGARTARPFDDDLLPDRPTAAILRWIAGESTESGQGGIT